MKKYFTNTKAYLYAVLTLVGFTVTLTGYAQPSSTTGYTVCQNGTVPTGQGLLASGCASGVATVTSFTGATTLTDPTFNRSLTGTTYSASAVGTAVHYTTHNFTVSVTG